MLRFRYKRAYFEDLWRQYRYSIVLTVLVIVRAISVLNGFPEHFLLGQHDIDRDYRVADHILRYQEFPLEGPVNSILPQLRNSPLYYYLLAILLIPFNDIITLQLWSLGLYLLTALLLFKFCRILSTEKIALATTVLYVSSTGISLHGRYMWQPHMMEPLLMGGYVSLALFYRSSKPRYLLLGTGLVAIAALVHPSVYAVLPVLMVTTLLQLRKSGLTGKWAVGLIVLFCGLLYFGFLPMIGRFPVLNGELWTVSLQQLPMLSIRNIQMFFTGVFYDSNAILAMCFILTIGLYRLFAESTKVYKKPMILVACLYCLSPVIALTALGKTGSAHHYTPVIGIFLFTYVYILSLLGRPYVLRVFSYCLYFIVLYVVLVSGSSQILERRVVFESSILRLAAKQTVFKLNQVSANSRSTNVSGVQVRSIRSGSLSVSSSETAFISYLEREKGQPIIRIKDNGEDFDFIKNNRQIIMLCDGISSSQQCKRRIDSSYPGYLFEKQLFRQLPYTVLLYRQVASVTQ